MVSHLRPVNYRLPVLTRLHSFVECGVDVFDQNDAALDGVRQEMVKFVVS